MRAHEKKMQRVTLSRSVTAQGWRAVSCHRGIGHNIAELVPQRVCRVARAAGPK